MKFHVSRKGEVSKCYAFKKGCPLGGIHFLNKEMGESYIRESFGDFSQSSELEKAHPFVLKNGELVREGLVRSSSFVKEVALKDGKNVNRRWNGSWEELEALVMKNFDNFVPGTGSVNNDVRLVKVPSDGFFTNIVEINDENEHLVETVFESRVSKENPVPINVIYSDDYFPASVVNIVIYRADVLAKDDDRSSEAEWEIVSVNSQPSELVPMHPETMKRNSSGAVGGTHRVYSDKEWKESEEYWAHHVYLRVKVED